MKYRELSKQGILGRAFTALFVGIVTFATLVIVVPHSEAIKVEVRNSCGNDPSSVWEEIYHPSFSAFGRLKYISDCSQTHTVHYHGVHWGQISLQDTGDFALKTDAANSVIEDWDYRNNPINPVKTPVAGTDG